LKSLAETIFYPLLRNGWKRGTALVLAPVIWGEAEKLKNKKNQFDHLASSMEAQEFKLVLFYRFFESLRFTGKSIDPAIGRESISYESYN